MAGAFRTANAFFKVIRTADRGGFVSQTCNYLDQPIVRIIREEQNFPFQQDALQGSSMDSSLVDMTRCLENGMLVGEEVRHDLGGSREHWEVHLGQRTAKARGRESIPLCQDRGI